MAKKTIKEKLSWNLDEILKAKDFEKLYKEIEKEMEQIEGWVKKLKPEMKEETFRGIMDFEEELGKKITRLEYMPYLWEQVDQKNQEAKKLKGRADDLGVRLAQKSRVISHWLIGKEMEGLKRLDDKNAKRLFATIPDLEYGLNYARTAAKYTLKKDEEDIISHKDVNGANQLINLREIIETEFEFDLKIKGKKTKKIRTLSELLSLVHSPKKTERKQHTERCCLNIGKILISFFWYTAQLLRIGITRQNYEDTNPLFQCGILGIMYRMRQWRHC